MELLIADQGVGSISERALNGFPVENQRLLVLGFGELQISAKSATSENGLADVCSVRPSSGLRAHQSRKGAAASEGASTRACERDLRKELRFGDADLGVR